jgi:paraquat-inducible protein A
MRECPDCGLVQRLPALPRGAVARCPRCEAVLRRHRTDPHGRALALAITGLLMFALAASMPFIDLDFRGLVQATTLVTGPEKLRESGLWQLAVVVLLTTVIAPLARLGGLAYVHAALHTPNPPRHVATVFRWTEWLATWSMVEVFLLGIFVAYTKLIDIAHVEIGTAAYALGGLMLAMAAAQAVMDPDAVWQTLERRGATARPKPWPVKGHRLGCESCGLVTHGTHTCPRCGAALHERKPNSTNRTWALLAAATVMYIPANLLPVMTVISFGQGSPSTILGGVMELAAHGMWPLAALVFFASVTVPMLKLVGLTILLISTHRGARSRLRERTRLYRIIDAIGRWSMIDVFMVSILTGLVRLGALASIYPGAGVLAFCSVVILTMIAAESFDPRLMWDAAHRHRA